MVTVTEVFHSNQGRSNKSPRQIRSMYIIVLALKKNAFSLKINFSCTSGQNISVFFYHYSCRRQSINPNEKKNMCFYEFNNFKLVKLLRNATEFNVTLNLHCNMSRQKLSSLKMNKLFISFYALLYLARTKIFKLLFTSTHVTT